MVGQTHYVGGRKVTNFRWLNRQFRKDALVNSPRLPACVKTGSRFKRITLEFEVAYTTAHSRLPLEQADAHAARGEQGGDGQPAYAPADNYYFIFHLLAGKAEQ